MTPEQKAAKAAYMNEYRQRPEAIAARKKRQAAPEYRAKRRAEDEARSHAPERLARQAVAYAKYDASTKGIIRRCRADLARHRREALALQD